MPRRESGSKVLPYIGDTMDARNFVEAIPLGGLAGGSSHEEGRNATRGRNRLPHEHHLSRLGEFANLEPVEIDAGRQ
jgi:hypothetical protein